MMRAIVLLHRWLGIAFCLLFAMWFATGIVMHFVPFPSLTESERFAGLVPLASAETRIVVADAVKEREREIGARAVKEENVAASLRHGIRDLARERRNIW